MTIFKVWLQAILGISIILMLSCNLKKEQQTIESDLLHILTINDCDSLMADSIFQKHDRMYWTKTKPKSVVEAVLRLDSMTNDYTKHLFKICRPIMFHLGFGMHIRNQWVHQGENELNDQLFNKLKLEHSDSSSGLILSLFSEYLNEEKINLMERLGERMEADSMKTVRAEFQKIEDELNKIKKNLITKNI